jgi:hypothetical protein
MTTRSHPGVARAGCTAPATTSPTSGTTDPAGPRRPDEPSGGGTRAELALDDALTVLDDLADDVDALNARIEALLADGRASR